MNSDAETGDAPPTVYYGLGPVGAPRPSDRRANNPPCVSRSRPTPSTAATSAPIASPVPTVLIPSDRTRTELVGTPLPRLTPTPGDTPIAPPNLDALGDVEELQFADSVTRFLHADWEREQQAEPTRHAAMRYVRQRPR